MVVVCLKKSKGKPIGLIDWKQGPEAGQTHTFQMQSSLSGCPYPETLWEPACWSYRFETLVGQPPSALSQCLFIWFVPQNLGSIQKGAQTDCAHSQESKYKGLDSSFTTCHAPGTMPWALPILAPPGA